MEEATGPEGDWVSPQKQQQQKQQQLSGKSVGMVALEQLEDDDMFVFLGGNPGSGKSTILNCLLGKARFSAGFSAAKGLTTVESKQVVDAAVDECHADEANPLHGWTLIDTPGLADVKQRKLAGLAIKRGLQEHGLYKLFFCLTLESGRVRSSDVATMITVLNALAGSSIVYHVIINKATQRELALYSSPQARQKLIAQAFSSIRLPPPNSLFFMPKEDDLEDAQDAFCSTQQASLLRKFVYNAEFCAIDKDSVRDLETDGLEELSDRYQGLMAEMASRTEEQIAALQQAAERENRERQAQHEGMIAAAQQQLLASQDEQRSAEAAVAAAGRKRRRRGLFRALLDIAPRLPVVGGFLSPVVEILRPMTQS